MHQNVFCAKSNGDLVTITVTALFVKESPQDLLGGKSVNREKIRVILDSDHNICGLYHLDKNHEQHYHDQDSIEFVEDQTDLYYLQTEDMNWTTYDNLTGFDLWHHRLGHVPNRNIEQAIQHSIGLRTSSVKHASGTRNVRRVCSGKVRSRIILDQWIRPHKSHNSWAGCTWICIHHPSHQLKGIIMLSYSSSLIATVG